MPWAKETKERKIYLQSSADCSMIIIIILYSWICNHLISINDANRREKKIFTQTRLIVLLSLISSLYHITYLSRLSVFVFNEDENENISIHDEQKLIYYTT